MLVEALQVRGAALEVAWGSATVEGGDKQNVVARLNLISFFPFKLPVGVVYEHQDARAAVSSQRVWSCHA